MTAKEKIISIALDEVGYEDETIEPQDDTPLMVDDIPYPEDIEEEGLIDPFPEEYYEG